MIGDHIRALRAGRWTHGIDCGDQTVLHVSDDASQPAASRLRRTYRPEFVAGAEAVEVVTHRERVYPPKVVVARAFSPIRDPALSAMFGDSEAFARWCKTGRLPERAAIPLPAARLQAPGRAAPRPAAKKPAARKAPARRPAAPAGRPAQKGKRPSARKAGVKAPRATAGRSAAAAKARRAAAARRAAKARRRR